jgi:hypothetical protein
VILPGVDRSGSAYPRCSWLATSEARRAESSGAEGGTRPRRPRREARPHIGIWDLDLGIWDLLDEAAKRLNRVVRKGELEPRWPRGHQGKNSRAVTQGERSRRGDPSGPARR